jgi:hypothetical protein
MWPGGYDAGQKLARVNPHLLPVPTKDQSMLRVESLNPEFVRDLQKDAKRLVEDSCRAGRPFAQDNVRLHRPVCRFRIKERSIGLEHARQDIVLVLRFEGGRNAYRNGRENRRQETLRSEFSHGEIPLRPKPRISRIAR